MAETASGLSELERLVREQLVEVLRVSPSKVKRTSEFMALGMDSLLALELRGSLESELGIRLPASTLWSHPSVDRLAAHLQELLPGEIEPPSGVELNGDEYTSEQLPVRADATPAEAERTVGDMRGASWSNAEAEPIAIIGASGRYPGASSLEELWSNLQQGKASIGGAPASRWPAGDPKQDQRRGGFIDNIEAFESALFRLSPHEAESMGPAVRLLLETAWRTFEDAGHGRNGERASGIEHNVGVFVGAMYNHYPRLVGASGRIDKLFDSSYFPLANRVSHFFDLHGPSLAIDTACASSTVAIHMACQSLRTGDCAMALAGGVNLTLHPNKFEGLADYEVLSTSGESRALGAGDGLVPGEGVGLVLLKPLAAALRDRDRIDAIITGSAVNHNGRGMGYTAPSPAVQAELIKRALTSAGVGPGDVDYVELAANGSPVAEEGEMTALATVFGACRDDHSVPVGTVKNNIGHLEAAAGISQLAKVLFQLRHRRLLPTINSEPHNPRLQLERTPFFVQTTAADWSEPSREPRGRRVLLNSFGGGGAAACLVVEEFQEEPGDEQLTPSQPCLLAFSAPDDAALDRLLEATQSWLVGVRESGADVQLQDLSRTLLTGRAEFEIRLAFVATSMEDVALQLESCRRGDNEAVFRGRLTAGIKPLEAFERDEDLRASVRAWLEKGRLERLAELWVNGVPIEWQRMPGIDRARLIRGPCYPFARTRLWPEVAASTGAAGAYEHRSAGMM